MHSATPASPVASLGLVIHQAGQIAKQGGNRAAFAATPPDHGNKLRYPLPGRLLPLSQPPEGLQLLRL